MPLFRRDQGPEPRRFRMRERLLSFGDDYWIEDEAGERVFHVDGKVARVRDTWALEDLAGNELARIREKKLAIRDTITIDLAGGGSAKVHKALISPLRDKFKIEVDDGPGLTAKGDILDHEYEIELDGDAVARVSRQWFHIRETFGVEVSATVDPVLILAVTVAVEALTHKDDGDGDKD
jgi:uncharacterized protein YxjI